MKQLYAPTPPQPLRVAKQKRSRLLMQSVREAALELLQTQGPDALTTVKIAERAGIGIGSLYRYYPNKEAVLTDLYDHQLECLDRRLRAYRRSDDGEPTLEEWIRESMAMTVGFHRELVALDAAFFSTFQRNFDITGRRGPGGAESWDTWAHRWLVEVLQKNTSRLRITDLEAAARLVIDMAYGTLRRIIETRPQALADAALTDELAQLALGYLLAPAPQ